MKFNLFEIFVINIFFWLSFSLLLSVFYHFAYYKTLSATFWTSVTITIFSGICGIVRDAIQKQLDKRFG